MPPKVIAGNENGELKIEIMTICKKLEEEGEAGNVKAD
jgi:hypothetical protein